MHLENGPKKWMNSPKARQKDTETHRILWRILLQLGVYSAPLTCWAVSILSSSIPRVANPFRRTSSVDSGTAAVSITLSDWDDRLHRSSIGSCSKKPTKLQLDSLLRISIFRSTTITQSKASTWENYWRLLLKTQIQWTFYWSVW